MKLYQAKIIKSLFALFEISKNVCAWNEIKIYIWTLKREKRKDYKYKKCKQRNRPKVLIIII